MTAQLFVSTWQQSQSLAEVISALGIDSRWASNYAAHLRGRGIPLKAMPCSRKVVTYPRVADVAELASQARRDLDLFNANLQRSKVARGF